MPWLLAKYSLWVCLDKISIRMGGLSKDHPTEGLKSARTEEGWVLPLLPLFLSALLELGQSLSPTYTCKFLVLRPLGLDWILPPSYLHLLCEPTRVSFSSELWPNTLYNPPTFSSSSCFFFFPSLCLSYQQDPACVSVLSSITLLLPFTISFLFQSFTLLNLNLSQFGN